MIILAFRTDRPVAELYLNENKNKLSEVKWQAHRKLAETIHKQILGILNPSTALRAGKSIRKLRLSDIQGIVCFKGPGSFTGLRIGMSVANSLAYAQRIPIVARGGDNWLKQGIDDLLAGKNDKVASPDYGAPAKTTLPHK